jgi:DNA invertase Pin-like site-specific DNA recombinase
VSTQEQEAEGKSLGLQEQILREYVRRRCPDREIVVYSETASARKTSRRRYQALMRDARAGRVAVVAAVEVSRLWRNASDAINDVRRLEGWGVELIIWNAGIDTSTAFGKLAFGLFALYSQFESDTVSERTKRSHAQLKAMGRRGPGRRPYGWQILEDESLARDPHEQAGADLAFAMRDQGATWSRIAAELNSRGYLPVSGRQWDPGGLRLVLQSVKARRADEAQRPKSLASAGGAAE